MADNNVSSLPATATFTCQQALDSTSKALEENGGYVQEILIIGWDKDNELFVRSSRMDMRASLWLLEQAKLRTLDVKGYRDNRDV